MSAESEVKKTNWKFLGQLLGALGVILSLIFVAWEIRQNTEAVENATIQSISEQSFTATNLIVQNEDLRIVFNMALDGRELSEDQETLINSFYQSALRVQMNRFLQTKLGILDPETALFLGGRANVYQTPQFSIY
ncbi:MAG: hypothetical protein P8L44_22850 [Opitutales bacterium]|jgi:hypothetical protein|nr:hypothetical protein [Opitutales bacterium]